MIGNVVSIHAVGRERRRANTLEDFQKNVRAATLHSSTPIKRITFGGFLSRLARVYTTSRQHENAPRLTPGGSNLLR